MLMKKFLTLDVALLLLRVALGAVFVAHGWQKLTHMEGTVMFFGSLGFPAVLAYLVALVEFLGGIAMLLGIFLPYAGTLIAIVMLVAAFYVKAGKSFIGGWEFDFVLLLLAVALAIAGPGRYGIKIGKELKS